MPKFSGITPNSTPSLTDYLIGVTSGNVDERVTIQNLLTLIAANWSAKPTLTGVMTATTLTNAYQDVATATLPATSAAHKYLIVASFTFNGGGTSTAYDSYGAIRKGGTIQNYALKSTINGQANYFFNSASNCIYTASASGSDVIQFSVQANLNSSGIAVHASSHYSIVDLGLA